jgi:hypothetical protein
MRLASTTEFLAWAAARGISRNSEFPHSENLWFDGEDATWYRYRPSSPSGYGLAFLEITILIAVAGGPFWIFPPWRGGTWLHTQSNVLPWEVSVRAEMEAAGIPVGYVGALHLAVNEATLAARLFAAAIEGNVQWPLTIVPEHARCLLVADENRDFLGAFPDDRARIGFTRALTTAGWEEPAEPDPRMSLTDPWLEL